MKNLELAQAIKAELASSGFPFDSVDVDNDEIRVIQIGVHRSLKSLCTILSAAGLWSFDDNSETEDARSDIVDTHAEQKTTNILKRVAS